MPDPNEYFSNEDGWFDHPRLRHWRRLQHEGATLLVDVKRSRRPLDRGSAYLYVNIERGGRRDQDREDWSADLNRGLLMLHVRALSPENEALRFALALPDAFDSAEDRFGEGFFNFVLIDELRRGPFSEGLREVLADVHVTPGNRDRPQYRECKDLVVGAIRGRAQELTGLLRYEQPQAEAILGSALATYLDDRFSISDRRVLGLG